MDVSMFPIPEVRLLVEAQKEPHPHLYESCIRAVSILMARQESRWVRAASESLGQRDQGVGPAGDFC